MGDNLEGAGRGCRSGGGGSKPLGTSSARGKIQFSSLNVGPSRGPGHRPSAAWWGWGTHVSLGGAGLGAHTCASRMCVAVPAGASQQHWEGGQGGTAVGSRAMARGGGQ